MLAAFACSVRLLKKFLEAIDVCFFCLTNRYDDYAGDYAI